MSLVSGVQLKVPVTGLHTQDMVKLAVGKATAALEFMVISFPSGSDAVIVKLTLSPGHTSIIVVSANTPPVTLLIGGDKN